MTRHDKRMTPAEARVRLEQLPNMLRAERERRGLTMRQAAKEMQLSPSTMTRVEGGETWPDLAGFLAMVAWLRIPPHWFIGAEDGTGLDSDAYARGWSDCATLVRSTLFEAEPVPVRKWEDAT